MQKIINIVKNFIDKIKHNSEIEKDKKRLILLAQQVALKEYPTRHWVFNMSACEIGKNGEKIIRLCFSENRIPPSRSWWIYKNDQYIKEIPFEEAEKIISIPAWR